MKFDGLMRGMQKKIRKECLSCCLRKNKEEMKNAIKKDPYKAWDFMPESCIYSVKEIIKIWDEDDKKRRVKK